jgi:extradiol dioxygenase family protein
LTLRFFRTFHDAGGSLSLEVAQMDRFVTATNHLTPAQSSETLPDGIPGQPAPSSPGHSRPLPLVVNETKAPVAPQTAESESEFSLEECRTIGKLPATDIERARRFYAEKLGLTRCRQIAPGHYIYECCDSLFLLISSRGRASGTHDHLVFFVRDVEVVVRQLKARGVVFEPPYDDPLAVWTGEISENERRRSAWFKDSEGNLLNVAQYPAVDEYLSGRAAKSTEAPLETADRQGSQRFGA